MNLEVVMGQNECTGSKVSGSLLYLNRVSVYLQTCDMTEIKLKSVHFYVYFHHMFVPSAL